MEKKELTTTLCHDSDHSAALELFPLRKSTSVLSRKPHPEMKGNSIPGEIIEPALQKNQGTLPKPCATDPNIHSIFYKPTISCHPIPSLCSAPTDFHQLIPGKGR